MAERSESRGRRSGLENVFPSLNISRSHSRSRKSLSSTRTRSLSPIKEARALYGTIKKSLRRGSGVLHTMIEQGGSEEEVRLNRRDFPFSMNPDVVSYKPGQISPETDFNEAAQIMSELKSALKADTYDREAVLRAYTTFLDQTMSELVFGSNMIERAGGSLDVTIRLCKRIWDGEKINAEDIDPRDAEYQQALLELQQHLKKEDVELTEVLKSRREIIQHAQALMFIVDAALNTEAQLTEELIKHAHKILCNGIPLQGTDIVNYAGVYRDTIAKAGTTIFTAPEEVPNQMAIFVDGFNKDIKERDDMDPFYLAADACQDFVTIHPFKDGNGRMCRLLANFYLIRYAGIVVGLGEREQDRAEYLEIAARGGNPDEEEIAKSQLARMFLDVGVRTLRKCKQSLCLGN